MRASPLITAERESRGEESSGEQWRRERRREEDGAHTLIAGPLHTTNDANSVLPPARPARLFSFPSAPCAHIYSTIVERHTCSRSTVLSSRPVSSGERGAPVPRESDARLQDARPPAPPRPPDRVASHFTAIGCFQNVRPLLLQQQQQQHHVLLSTTFK